ncbi:MAG: DUF3800 domain-containing protein [Armatimonadota bacterium]
MKYRIYIDEVGNSDLGSCQDPNHRFLSLTGVIVELGHVQSVIHPQMEALKGKYFNSHPDEPIIFHRKEMVNFRQPFEALADDTIRDLFDAEILGYLNNWDYKVITVCIDKKKHTETYTAWRHDPYHYCMAVLLERYVFFLGRNSAEGDVMAESRGGKEDIRLKKSFERIWENGTEYVEPKRFQDVLTSKQLKVKSKANNIAGLQLADLIAHPSRNEILNEQNLLMREMGPFGKSVVGILRDKYDMEAGRIFGKKFI